MKTLHRLSRRPIGSALVLAAIVPAALVLSLVLFGLAAAQSGNGYDLTWSTVDGGGHTWSTGSGYTLGAAVGQPDAQAPAAGAGYALQGGFWHAACRPAAVHVDITCDGAYAHLTWTPDAANLAYDIYRATKPSFTPGPANKAGADTDGDWPDPMPNTCGDTAVNYYYQVRSTCVGGHANANRVAEFDFSLVPGAGP